MQVSNANDVKIYNLSAGKSLPDWLSDRKRRSLLKNDLELQRRIELIQNFEMPTVSNCLQMSPDQQYIYASGVYKPRVKCYEVSNMSMKFERCMDSEVVKFKLLSDDYSKLVMLQSDRHVEFHSQSGNYFKIRIPKNGRDFSYHYPSCDLYFVGASPEIYRFNLEQGRFMKSLVTNASEINCSEFNPVHQLFACGTKEGKVECWDPRSRMRAGQLDCVLGSLEDNSPVSSVPAVTCLKFRDGLTMGVGTSTGQILLYDLRSDKPLLVKDHYYDLPIKVITFHEQQNLVLSMDKKIVKMWDRNTGKPFTSIEPGTDLNDLCIVPDTGMLFMANEAPKILAYYVPVLGPAPKWCSFLDSLTEELEENQTPTVYDDYKFLTRQEVESLGLSHLIGSNMMRAYMHGYFIDVRLYNKAKSIAEPFAYEDYRRTKVHEKIEESRANRVKLKKLPKVNRELAEKLIEIDEGNTIKKKGKKQMPSLLKDDRFSAMFSNPEFEVDTESAEYRLLNPVVAQIDSVRKKRNEQDQKAKQTKQNEEEPEGRPSSEEESSDDDQEWRQEVKKQHQLLRQEKKMKKEQEQLEAKLNPKFIEGQDLQGLQEKKKKKKKDITKTSLGSRLKETGDRTMVRKSGHVGGNMEATFRFEMSDKDKKRRKEAELHHAERRKIRRSAAQLPKKKSRNF